MFGVIGTDERHMICRQKDEIIRGYAPVTPKVDTPHLVGPRRALAEDPLPKARNGNAANFIGGLFDRETTIVDVISELHDRHIPQNGVVGQPRFGARAEAPSSGTNPTMGNRLKTIREGRRMTQEQAAEALNLSKSGYIKLERGERKLSTDFLDRFARVFDVPITELVAQVVDIGENVPIVGLAGAGPDGSVLFSHTDGEFGFGPSSPNSSGATVALEVRGDSMRGIASEGWLVYYDEEQNPPREDMIGELCVVGLEDDRVLVKVLQPGRDVGLFDLESFNAAVMRDVPVRWASLVTSIIPRKPARQLIKRTQ